MTKGIPNARNENIRRSIAEAKRVMLLTRSWPRTKIHLDQWLRIKFLLGSRSVNEYIKIIEANILSDEKLAEQLKQPAPISNQKSNFVPASELK